MSETHLTVGLDDFLAALRFEGIAIGPQELVRLQHAFRLAPSLDRQDLKDLLACTLIKQDTHREAFESLFETWCPPDRSPATLLPQSPSPSPSAPWPGTKTEIPQPDTPYTDSNQPSTSHHSTSFRISRRFWIVALTTMLLATLGYVMYTWQPEPVEPIALPKPTTAASQESPPPAKADLPSEPAEQFWTWTATFDPPAPPPIDLVLGSLTIVFLSLLGAAFVWWRYRRRNEIPQREATRASGPQWLPVLPSRQGDTDAPELLDRAALHTAVWGVEHFVSEDETPEVDVDATVAATATAAGLPTISFEHAVYPREVWLWRDEMVQDPTLDRLLDELEQTLSLAGLPVRLGTFFDTPTLVRWHSQQEFSPLILEGYRQSALVVILTDGHGMQLAGQSALEEYTLSNLLRSFSEWPRLAFADVGNGQYGLAPQVQAYGLACIAPEDIPTFLGASPVKPVIARPAATDLLGDLRVWAAATALSSEPVTSASAFELRHRLGLDLPAWDFRDLLISAHSVGDRLVWPFGKRIELLNWLRQCSITNGVVEDESDLAQALAYWMERYAHTHDVRDGWHSPLLPWDRTPAEQRLRLETAMLKLWREPTDAACMLYGLDGALRDEIRERLTGMADGESASSSQADLIILPWKTADLPIHVRWMLARMGFGARSEREVSDLHPPLRLSLALGVCAGVAIMALASAIGNMRAPVTPTFQPELPAAFASVMIRDVQRSGVNEFRIAVGTPKVLQVDKAPAKSVIDVTWEWAAQPNIQRIGKSELWRTGTLPQVIRGCEESWPRRSLVAIQAEPSDIPARQLAIQLLDRGSADAVLLGTDWASQVHKLIQVDAEMTSADQLLLILPPDASARQLAFQGVYGAVHSRDFKDLALKLNFPDVKPLAEIWPEAKSDADLKLRGGPEISQDEKTGMTFVKVCGGTFTMGGKKDADNAEKPQHTVTMSPFEISQTEVTNAQYRKFRPNHEGDDRMPVVDVTWDDAKAFCEQADSALPTEAEWEYAARGGSITRWSFGDDESQLGDYAWFTRNSGYRSQEVATRLPNPLGLRDMHGNVWEWVEDCYDSNIYASRARQNFLDNPVNLTNCEYRVLRGGAFLNFARDLRSAYRDGFEPVLRFGYIGFRCVRRPRRQP